MAQMQPKDFIKTVFIDELGQIISTHAYISFMVIGIGIEFIGKCIDTQVQDWNQQGNSKKHFKKAITDLQAFAKYKPYLNTYKLYHSFRCGLVHAAVPKFQVTLSSKNEAPNLGIFNNRLNLKIEDLYQDFKSACNEVINKNFANNDKMNSPYLQVPDQNILPNIVFSGST